MPMQKKFLVGLIGADIQMSKSPALHETEGRRQGLDYRYELLDFSERGLPASALPDLLDEAEQRGFAGSNITHPCKQTVIAHLSRLSEDAEMLGAVNTVVFRNGERIGHNTDWYGFYENFQRGLPDVAKSHAVLLGAGGAGVAVAHAAIKLGIETLSIFDQDSKRAETLAQQLNDRFSRDCARATTDVGSALRSADGLIHATPTGMKSHPGLPIDAEWLLPRHWVADIVYMPLVTELLALAEGKGCRTLRGGGMTVYQAAAAFELFTGIAPDADRMSLHFTDLCRLSA
ncbi:MAG: shikimate dehydrogenase [Mesorhizobium sp.]|uniref:shikimate dehydrogenase n=2 Tax=Mesorhizobium TaxID=68287 RepID=UPI000F759131|nr:shikimate dehydrogenase [Mesorhizobium sp. M4B.F.Ca.ET.058.02.1.1]RUX52358.1 shikimate dehydrogenase [Mesorhizobium sp. M4A.F.Ca.ET.050.02.1.1]RVD73006.1 shikimate dehydrogenase [Mesorhizobium sp. M4A.F.Ca.ET.029.04.2.1]RWC54549.1 MAG: shikimate dehydrogenase [Mesorhizobium sp.]TIU72506.1 MAG: shikimate dehydrogenase [Mesorhizobium sp.]